MARFFCFFLLIGATFQQSTQDVIFQDGLESTNGAVRVDAGSVQFEDNPLCSRNLCARLKPPARAEITITIDATDYVDLSLQFDVAFLNFYSQNVVGFFNIWWRANADENPGMTAENEIVALAIDGRRTETVENRTHQNVSYDLSNIDALNRNDKLGISFRATTLAPHGDDTFVFLDNVVVRGTYSPPTTEPTRAPTDLPTLRPTTSAPSSPTVAPTTAPSISQCRGQNTAEMVIRLEYAIVETTSSDEEIARYLESLVSAVVSESVQCDITNVDSVVTLASSAEFESNVANLTLTVCTVCEEQELLATFEGELIKELIERDDDDSDDETPTLVAIIAVPSFDVEILAEAEIETTLAVSDPGIIDQLRNSDDDGDGAEVAMLVVLSAFIFLCCVAAALFAYRTLKAKKNDSLKTDSALRYEYECAMYMYFFCSGSLSYTL